MVSQISSLMSIIFSELTLKVLVQISIEINMQKSSLSVQGRVAIAFFSPLDA